MPYNSNQIQPGVAEECDVTMVTSHGDGGQEDPRPSLQSWLPKSFFRHGL
jgi:hypothetical protein